MLLEKLKDQNRSTSSSGELRKFSFDEKEVDHIDGVMHYSNVIVTSANSQIKNR